MRGLSYRQKLKIKKYGLLILSVMIITTVFMSIPSMARALPDSLADILTTGSKAEYNISHQEERLTAIMGDSFSAVLGYDYEIEPEIPKTDNIEGAKYVKAVNLCWYSYEDNPKLHLLNRTDFKVDLNDYKNLEFPIRNTIDSAPVVLIVHTHGTESYLEEGKDYYTAGETFRSEDITKNVVAVGEVLVEELINRGINTVHDKTMQDKDSFSNSYSNSKRAVAEYLLRYPSIKYVVDIHRDAVFTSDGVNQKPVTSINNNQVAQVMLVVGTNQGGANHPDWKKNLTVAVNLQDIMNQDYPTLARPLCLRTASFNQQLSPGYLLLEIGSCGNTIEEAKNAAKLFATSMAEMIYSK